MHRYLKPENLAVDCTDSNNILRIISFWVRANLMNSISYIAPEVFQNDKQYNEKIWCMECWMHISWNDYMTIIIQ